MPSTTPIFGICIAHDRINLKSEVLPGLELQGTVTRNSVLAIASDRDTVILTELVYN